MTEKSTKNFDCIKFVREVRRQMYEETKDMSREEYEQHRQKFRENDPVWKRWEAQETAREGIGQKSEQADGHRA